MKPLIRMNYGLCLKEYPMFINHPYNGLKDKIHFQRLAELIGQYLSCVSIQYR